MGRLLEACNGKAVMVQDVEGVQSQTLAKVPCVIENPTGEVAWCATYIAYLIHPGLLVLNCSVCMHSLNQILNLFFSS